VYWIFLFFFDKNVLDLFGITFTVNINNNKTIDLIFHEIILIYLLILNVEIMTKRFVIK